MEGARDTILFDQFDIRVGTQPVQVIGGELSGVTADEVELMGDVALGRCEVGSEGGEVDSKRHPSLEDDDVPARGRVGNVRDGEKIGGHEEGVL